jgi:hypothetical protein
MNRCASVRRSGSTDQCLARALVNHTLCGRHAKCKRAVLWSEIHTSRGTGLVRCQALIRGWLVRRHMRLSGPGVCSRSQLMNDEDPVTLEGKHEVHPFSYFGVKENGKVFWFTFDTIYKWCLRSPVPMNPFTKVPLSKEARIRVREGWSYRQRRGIPLPSESMQYEERILGRWTILCQLFEDYGFGEIDPSSFLDLTKSQYRTLFLLVRDDLTIALSIANPSRDPLIRYCTRGIHVASTLPVRQYILQSVYTLLIMLTRQRDSYPVAFIVLSALSRC